MSTLGRTGHIRVPSKGHGHHQHFVRRRDRHTSESGTTGESCTTCSGSSFSFTSPSMRRTRHHRHHDVHTDTTSCSRGAESSGFRSHHRHECKSTSPPVIASVEKPAESDPVPETDCRHDHRRRSCLDVSTLLLLVLLLDCEDETTTCRS